MSFDLSFWIQWERHSLVPGLQLERCLGGTSRAAVFAAQFEGRPVAVKLFPGDPESILAHLASWKRTASLAHPALQKILHTGEAPLGHTRCAYAVMERADETLGDVLADRLLTPDEARDMLGPLLSVLRFLHSKGYAHGSVKPSNLLALGDQLQISSDSLVQGGDTSADCRAIGTLLQHVLGGFDHRPPEPFAGIVNGCLEADPTARWKLPRIEAHLRGEPPPVEGSGARMKWWALGGVAAAAMAGLLVMRPTATEKPVAAPPPPPPPAPVVSTPPPPPETQAVKPEPAKKESPKSRREREREARAKAEAAKPKPEPPPTAPAPVATAPAPVATGSIRQVMPEIPQQARNTIVGRVRINIRVRVDADGNVTQASVQPPRVSPYFTERALAASRAWKFPPGGAAQDWVLRYDLGRDQTRVSPERAGN